MSFVLAFGLLWWPFAAAAQTDRGEREVDVLGAPGERPVSAYGAADVPLTLVFDAPLKVPDGGVLALAPGIDSRAHPFERNALIVTPSKDAAPGGEVRFRVPLENWVAEIKLDLGTEKIDHVVRILRRGPRPDGGIQMTPSELGHLLGFLASVAIQGNGCGMSGSREMPRPEKIPQRRNDVLVCAMPAFTVVRVKRPHPTCTATGARVLRGDGTVDVLYMSGTAESGNPNYQTLVLRTPPDEADDYELELLGADGTVCDHYQGMILQPGGTL